MWQIAINLNYPKINVLPRSSILFFIKVSFVFIKFFNYAMAIIKNFESSWTITLNDLYKIYKLLIHFYILKNKTVMWQAQTLVVSGTSLSPNWKKNITIYLDRFVLESIYGKQGLVLSLIVFIVILFATDFKTKIVQQNKVTFSKL